MSDSSRNDDNTLLSWLGFKVSPDYTRAKPLGRFLGAGIVLIVLSLAFFLISDLYTALAKNEAEDTRNYGLLLAALISAPLLVWRSHTAHRQAEIAEQGLITDRIAKAVEQIGAEKTVQRQLGSNSGNPKFGKVENPIEKNRMGFDTSIETLTPFNSGEVTERDLTKPISETVTLPNLEVRIGGLYALERIAQDSPRDHIQIMEILSAYVRENATIIDTNLYSRKDIPASRADIQTVIDILGRRSTKLIEKERKLTFRLNLSNTDLSRINFLGGNFTATDFRQCKIISANFSGTNLRGTIFNGSLLSENSWDWSDLTGARFDSAVFSQSATGRTFHGQELATAKSLKGISIAGADFSSVSGLNKPARLNEIFGSTDTKLPENNRQFDPEKSNLLRLDLSEAITEENQEKIKSLEIEICNRGFRYWSTERSHDIDTMFHRDEFLKAMGLQGFPYE